MAQLYADEQFPLPVVKILRNLGHNILTVQEAGKADQKIPDREVLQFALSLNRAVLTMNRRDFIQLHHQYPKHTGIVICRSNTNWEKVAQTIHNHISGLESLTGQLVRVKFSSTSL